MFSSLSLALLTCALYAPPAAALGTPVATIDTSNASPELNVYYETDPLGYKFTASLEGGAGRYYALYAKTKGTAAVIIGQGMIGGDITFTAQRDAIDLVPYPVEFFAAFVRNGKVVKTQPADLVLGVSVPCDELNFNHAIGSDADMIAGNLIDNEWADIGIAVSAVNKNAAHPNKAILFDSAMVTGEDPDLMTPNAGGFDNDTPYGHILIIAEDDVDTMPADGFVDDPDDEAAGGSLIFDFEDKATICSVTMVDIDEQPGTELRFYRNGNLAVPDETLSILSLGDGSVQRVEFSEADVDRFEVFFKGSGAIARVELIPCPRLVNFDETSTGIPLALSTGEEILEQFANIGLHIKATNNNGSHPDKAILFDSENPTGEDFDLLTPNPMVPGNDTPLGKVLIIAEDDVDTMPADGLVDDPDDEAGGGTIFFRFDQDVTFVSARVLDCDANEVDTWRFLDKDDNEITSIVIPDLPDGNVQIINANVSGVRRALLILGGSGAVTRIRFCPDPVSTPGTPPVQ